MAKRKSALEALPIQVFSRQGGPQRSRFREGSRFGAERRQLFLDALTLTCNIRMSADHAGIHPNTAYRARTHDPVFAAQWREALDMGLERLEAQVIEHGGAGLPLEPGDPDRALAQGAPPFDFDRAVRALELFAKLRAGVARKPNAPAPSAEDTDAAITRLIGKIRKRAAIEPGEVRALPAPDGTGEEA